jgi:alpha-mannosidase
MSLTLEWRHRIMAWREELSKHFYKPIDAVPLEAAFTKQQYRLIEAFDALTFEPIDPGTPWGSKWEYGWFRGEIKIPVSAKGQMIALSMDVGAESAVFINGDCAGAVDEYHKVIILTDKAQGGEAFSVVLEAYAGHGPQEWRSGPTPPDRETIPEPPENQRTVGESHFGIWQEAAFQLAMDVETLWEVRESIDEDSLRVMEIDEALKDFTLIADFEAPHAEMLASLQSARERLQPLLEKQNGDTTPEMIGFGHAHIDVAWLWPLAETKRKCVRTFSTQLALMDRYPQYQFFQSQPQLYVMVKEKYPELYERIQKAVKRGQWIPDGAAWVEPDTNVTSGESLIRQLIHGKRFYREEFGVNCDLLWLPDVFGYSGALPQIMRGCEIKYFSTQKIFWAYHGGAPFPYNTFVWEGIDGSEVLAHFHNDYNSETKPSLVIERWKERVQKDGFSTRLYPFGWGDGGGGPTREHLEYALRQKNLEGAPKFRIASPMIYFTEQEAAGWPEARYVGELYFQAHRGTYTSQARTKALNRRSEFALREAEFWGSAAIHLADFDFPYDRWDKAWKTVLINQFHDILPGSSIARVYEEAEAQLSDVVETAGGMAKDAAQLLLKDRDGLTWFNALSWEREPLVILPEGMAGLMTSSGEGLPAQTLDDKTFAEVQLPSCGWVSFIGGEPQTVENTISADSRRLENALMQVNFNDFGEITCIYDKVNQRQLNIDTCNSLRMYQDIPSAFDAWDIDSMYRQTPVDLPEKAEISLVADGPLFGQLVVKRVVNHSTMTQTITLRRDSRRMDFHTVIDWQERHKLLKVNFPVGYHARDAIHEIQFGHLPRPTHRSREIDRDRHEVANYKWTALVEAERGFAILNDSKYGVDVLDNNINLTLLKSALAPDMTADRGRQEFTYAFYFWDTPFIESGVVQQGYELNVPPLGLAGSADPLSLFSLNRANIILETVKPAEDGSGDVVLRLYESMSTRTCAELKINLPVERVQLTNMLESPKAELAINKQTVQLEFGPFEILTLRLKMA